MVTKGKLNSVDIPFADTRIRILDTAFEEIEKHNLSDAVLKVLAYSYAGYPIAGKYFYKTLVKRGFFTPRAGYYRKTQLYNDFCAKAFLKTRISGDE